MIGTVGEQSGVIGGFINDGVKAVEAWVAWVNANGGINCHPVKYIVADDGGSPSKNQALTEQLVDQDHVIAFVHLDAPIAGQAGQAFINAHQIPAIGSETGSPWFYDSPYYFPQTTTGAPTLVGAIGGVSLQAKAKGLTKLGVIACVEVPICTPMYDDAPSAAKQFGVTLAYRAQVTLEQPSYTSTCQAMEQAGVQFIVATIDPNSFSRLAASCLSINYHPIYGTGGPVVNNTVFSDSKLNGMLLGSAVELPGLSSIPAVAQFQSIIKEYAPGLPPDGAAMTGWVSALLFGQAARSTIAAGSTPTSSDVLNGLWSMKNNTVDGLTLPLTFTRGQDSPQTLCFWEGYVGNGQVYSPDNGQRVCE